MIALPENAMAPKAAHAMPNPNPGQPWVGPGGRVVQPPPEGWPDYTKGGGSDMGGGRN